MRALRNTTCVAIVFGLTVSAALGGLFVVSGAFAPIRSTGPSAPTAPALIPCCPGGGDSYDLNFLESGLPSGTSWSVKVAGVTESSTTDEITFSEDAGTYSYTVSALNGYDPSPSSGSATISSKAVTVDVTFSTAYYDVTFQPSHLRASLDWTVTLNGEPIEGGGTTSASYDLADGSYSYTISAPVNHAATPSSGSITVNGVAITQDIRFSNTVHRISFTESGLSGTFHWSVTLAGTTNSSTTSKISFVESNGSYGYSVQGPPGYSIAPPSGSVTLSGANVSVSVTFTLIPYTVTFVHLGAPGCLPWYVNISGGASLSGDGSSLATTLVDGNYSYTWASGVLGCDRGTGSVEVNNAAVSVGVTFSTTTYPWTFTRTGLPAGTEWCVDFEYGGKYCTTAASQTIPRANGTYTYSVSTTNRNYAAPPGSITVSGSSGSVSVNFELVTYTVTFELANLPTGADWSLTFNGTRTVTDAPAIPLYYPNGTYAYNVTAPAGYLVYPVSGSVTVAGAVVTRQLGLTGVVFSATGLPGNVQWSATVGTTTASTSSSTLPVPVGNGTYHYTLTSTGRTPTPGNGTVTVAGVPAAISVHWAPTRYAVTFTAAGLPSGDSWTVVLNGTSESSTAAAITFDVAGLGREYAYTITAPAGLAENPSQGTVTVGTGPVSVAVTMGTGAYVVFSGALSGWNWSVTVGGLTESGVGRTITFSEPSGTFPFSVSAETRTADGVTHYGYPTDGGQGTFTNSGSGATVTIAFETVTYLNFTEGGLASGASWTVTLNGTARSSTASEISFEVAPDAYDSYTVAVPTSDAANPDGGTLWVGLSPVSQAIAIGYGYAVTFTGAVSGWDWTVTIGGVSATTTNGSVTFAEPNGTIAYSAGAEVHYATQICIAEPTNGAGHVTVNGAAVSVHINFGQAACTCEGLFHGACIDDPIGTRSEAAAIPGGLEARSD